MILDLTRPEHRNALFNACTLTPEERAHYLAHMGDDNGPCVQFCRALSSPSDSAALVRTLLEGCGVEVDDFKFIKTRLTMWECAGEIYFEDPKRWGPDPRWPAALLRMRDIPALILRLLACTSKEEALAALREAGR